MNFKRAVLLVCGVFAAMVGFVVLSAIVFNHDNKEEAVAIHTPTTWDGAWVFSILGEPSDDFDEFKLFIHNDEIVVKQGYVSLWIGSFNPDMPMEGDFTIKSRRNLDADLPYTPSNVMDREFRYKDGTLTYIEGENGNLEFIKAM